MSPCSVLFRIFVKGGGGKCNNCRVEWGQDCSNTSSVFSSAKNNVVLINLFILATMYIGGSGGMLPQEIFLIFQSLRLFLAASETQLSELGRSLSVISTGSFNSQIEWDGGDMFPPAQSAKLKIMYGLKMSKIADLNTSTIQTFNMYMYDVCGYSQGGGGSQLPRGRGECPCPPK